MWEALAFIFSNLFTLVVSFFIGAYIGMKITQEEKQKE